MSCTREGLITISRENKTKFNLCSQRKSNLQTLFFPKRVTLPQGFTYHEPLTECCLSLYQTDVIASKLLLLLPQGFTYHEPLTECCLSLYQTNVIASKLLLLLPQGFTYHEPLTECCLSLYQTNVQTLTFPNKEFILIFSNKQGNQDLER